MGKLIVLEGLDGSGKATQTGLLLAALQREGVRAMSVTFPDYESDSSALVRMYLGGAFGDDPGAVNAYAASTFYAVDRYASYRINWKDFYAEGGVVLADRYTTSNCIHQCAKLPREEWKQYTAWLEDFEYGRLGIPKPDRVLFLDVEPQVSRRLMLARGRQQDIHEKNDGYLQKCREAALWCTEELGWAQVPCTSAGCMLPRDEIADAVIQSVREVL